MSALLLLALVTPSASAFIDYDELGQVIARRGNNGQNVTYTYDDDGNVKTVTDSIEVVTSVCAQRSLGCALCWSRSFWRQHHRVMQTALNRVFK